MYMDFIRFTFSLKKGIANIGVSSHLRPSCVPK